MRPVNFASGRGRMSDESAGSWRSASLDCPVFLVCFNVSLFEVTVALLLQPRYAVGGGRTEASAPRNGSRKEAAARPLLVSSTSCAWDVRVLRASERRRRVCQRPARRSDTASRTWRIVLPAVQALC